MTDAGAVGFIGLGNMGDPMSRALLLRDFPVVGFDAQPGPRARLADGGGVAVGDAAAVAGAADIIVMVLPNSDVVESVADELFQGGVVRPGKLIIDMSSSEPQRTRVLAKILSSHGVGLIDAPVSGGVRRAELATLTIMAGGDTAELERARPVLSAMGTVTHVGPVGSGHAVKALNNLLSATHLLATAEAMAAGERFGLDPEVMLSVFNSSSGRSGSTENKWPDYVLTGRYDSGFALGLMVKDMRIALGLIRGVGTAGSLGSSAVEAWSRAGEALPSGADHTEIAHWVRDLAESGPTGRKEQE